MLFDSHAAIQLNLITEWLVCAGTLASYTVIVCYHGGEGGQFKLLIVDNTDGHMEKQETEMKWKLEMETGNGNWKWKWEQKKTHQSLVQCFLHSVVNHVLSHYSCILLSNGYRILAL